MEDLTIEDKIDQDSKKAQLTFNGWLGSFSSLLPFTQKSECISFH